MVPNRIKFDQSLCSRNEHCRVAFIPTNTQRKITAGKMMNQQRVGFRSRGLFGSSSHHENTAISTSPLDTSDPASLQKAAKFMTHNFWLPNSNENDKNYGSIAFTVYVDMLDRYGPRMEAHKFDSCILEAHSSAGDEFNKELVGLIGIDVVLFEMQANTLQSREESEAAITGAVTSLKGLVDANQENVSQRLPSGMKAVVVLSNLVVSTSLRRMGIGAKLCLEAERFVKEGEGWGGFTDIYVRVESENLPARKLYQLLGYDEQWDEDSTIVESDLDAGKLATCTKNIVIMKKSI